MTEQANINSFKTNSSTENLAEKYKAEMMKIYKKSQNYVVPTSERRIVPEPVPEVVPEVLPEITEDTPNIINEDTPRVIIPEIIPRIVPEEAPEVIPKIVPQIVPQQAPIPETTSSPIDLTDPGTCPVQETCGFLQVEVTSANGTMPIENAYVTIYETRGNDKILHKFTTTNQNGETPVIPLPATSKELYDLQQNRKSYSIYNVVVLAKNYQPVENLNVPIFATIKSIQPVSLVPITPSNDNTMRNSNFKQPVNPNNNPNNNNYYGVHTNFYNQR